MLKYDSINKAIFIARPNRFIAHCMLEGKQVVCHVKNTGRCAELLIEGATVFLQENFDPKRKTKYSLIAVIKNGAIFNIDSQAPNKVVYESLKSGTLLIPELAGHEFTIKPEFTYKASRLDFYLESEINKVLIEVKGVTLEQDGVAMFPDAPTLRGVKHLNELAAATEDGYICYVVFLVQFESAKFFTPNYTTHRDFGEALKNADNSGVRILCYSCDVTPDSLSLKDAVDIKLEEQL